MTILTYTILQLITICLIATGHHALLKEDYTKATFYGVCMIILTLILVIVEIH